MPWPTSQIRRTPRAGAISPNGYYPYHVFSDPSAPGRSVFAFYPHPEDVVHKGGDDQEAALTLGQRSRETVERWVPVLARLAAPAGGAMDPGGPQPGADLRP